MQVTKDRHWFYKSCSFLIGFFILGEAMAGADPEFEFDCLDLQGTDTFVAVGYTFRIPDGFRADPVEDNSIILPSATDEVLGERLLLNVVTISYGQVDNRLSSDWQEQKWFEFNDLGIQVRTSSTLLPLNQYAYQAVFISGDEQIAMTSIVPIDWRSFLSCMIG